MTYTVPRLVSRLGVLLIAAALAAAVASAAMWRTTAFAQGAAQTWEVQAGLIDE